MRSAAVTTPPSTNSTSMGTSLQPLAAGHIRQGNGEEAEPDGQQDHVQHGLLLAIGASRTEVARLRTRTTSGHLNERKAPPLQAADTCSSRHIKSRGDVGRPHINCIYETPACRCAGPRTSHRHAHRTAFARIHFFCIYTNAHPPLSISYAAMEI